MFFRSVSALPKCLHGRLAPGRYSERLFNSSPSGLSALQRCPSSLGQTAIPEQYSNGLYTDLSDGSTRGVQPADLATTQPENVKTDGDETVPDSDTRFNHRSPDSSQSSSHPEPDPTEEKHHLPSFVRKVAFVGEPDIVQHSRNKAKQSRRYEDWEWEALHDKFLETRRNEPDRTSHVFHKQRVLARRIVGDFEHGEASSLEFRCKWAALDTVERLKILPTILIGSLAESAAQALFVLDGIRGTPQSFRIRMNCLRDIALMYWKDLQNDPWLKTLYEMQIERLRTPQSWPEDKMPTVLLQNLLFWSAPEQCERIIRDFQEKYPDAATTSLTATIDHYLRIGDREAAFVCLQQLPDNLLREPDDTVSALRDRLVKLDVVTKTENGTNFTYLPQLLSLGIPSDESLHNAVIESALTNGLPEVAWDVYQYLESSKFNTNARSYLVLLRDSFQRGDLQRVNDIMTALHCRNDLIRDSYLVAYSMNIVRAISCHEKKLKPSEALAHVMALYDRAYDRSALTRLGIVPASTAGGDLLQPSPTLLAFTIWTYVLIQNHDSNVMRLWEWIKYSISDGDKSIIDAARHDVIFNGLVLYHGRKAKGLARALGIVQFMLSSKLCLPTSRTWSILLCSFLKHGQEKQARSVLSMMQQKGFRVEEVEEKYHEYVPAGYDLKEMMATADSTLDEKQMPAGLEELMAESRSLN